MREIEGDVNVVNAMLFGGTSPAMRELIEKEHTAFISTVSPSWGSAMLERTKEVFNSFNGDKVMQFVDKAINNLSAVVKPDAIYRFVTIEELQSAKPIMQSYIMANPVIRKAYHRGLCDGYSDSYVDPKPDVIGFGHEAHDHVMDGVIRGVDGKHANVRLADLKEEHDLQFSNYSNAFVGPDQLALDVVAKGNILNTWYFLEKAYEEGEEDPVNPWGGKL